MASTHHFCAHCGERVDPNAQFCPNCGATVADLHSSSLSVSVAQPVTQSAQLPVADPPPPVAVSGSVQNISYAAVPPPPLRSAGLYGGFWIRVLALLIDVVILTVVFLVLEGICNLILPLLGVAIAGVLELVGSWIYCAAMESSVKQATLGKMACGLVVTDLEGRRISFARATGRYFCKYVLGTLLVGLGYVVVAFTDKKQGLHDLIVGTLVWRKH